MTPVELIIEAIFAVVFVRTLVSYLRGRDPVQRDVMVMFGSLAVLFVLAVIRRWIGEPPELVADLASALLLAQPLLTLRVVRRLRAVPYRVYSVAFAGWLTSALALLLTSGELPRILVAVIVVVFVLTEGFAALFLAGLAGRHTGGARARLIMAAAATALFATAIMAAGAGAGDPDAVAVARQVAQVLAVLSAVGYAGAFAPPSWLRQVWSSRAAYRLVRHLLSAPAEDSPGLTWQRYAETVREVAGADAAAVLLSRVGEPVRHVAQVGLPAWESDREPVIGPDDFPQRATTVAVAADRRDPAARLARAYAELVDARFVTLVPLPLHDRQGLLVLPSRYRTLFSDDDVQLLGELGSQAGALAERGQLLDDRDRLTAELSESITALRTASQAKSDFLASMSHELRTPLNAIIGFSDLMRTEPALDERTTVPTEWIHHINSSGHHLLGLINEVLDLAKIEAGQIELRPEAIDLPDAITDVVSTLRALSDRKQLEVTVAIPALRVQADPMRFRQIVTNLLSNAIKFTPVGGHIYLAVRRHGNEVALSVADTGTGIAVEDQQRIFDEFQQAGEQGARTEGTGLGLALTRRLVQAHGGRIELESSLGHGAKFIVYLPAARPAAPVPNGGPGAPNCRTGVLVIEDDTAAAQLLSTYLDTAGFHVSVAATGEEGLAFARSCSPEAILLDLQLPGIDGWQVLNALKADDRLRHIPVVIISVADDTEIGLALGAVDYFVKPVSRPALLSWLARQGLIPPMGGQPVNVLAIDDDPHSLEIIRTALSTEGLRVVSAGGGAEGLRLARSTRYDLIICDLMMPDVDGFDVIAALHDDAATRDIPVVVLTAHTPTEAEKARLGGKVMGVMSKGQIDTGLPDLARTVGELTGLTHDRQEALVH